MSTVNKDCRGCQRFKVQQNSPSFYSFGSFDGWEPSKLIIDTDVLNVILKTSPREPYLIEASLPVLREMRDYHEIFDEHVDHVDETIPVLIGEYTFTNQSGESQLFQLCSDGHHRIAKLIKLNKDVPFYLFTEEEMQRASFLTMKSYMESKGIFVLGGDVEELLNT